MTSISLTNFGAFDVEELDARTMEDVRGGGWVTLLMNFIRDNIIPDAVAGYRDRYQQCL